MDFALKLDFSQILTNPILDIAARFWEDERYEAFRTCYRSMRFIDDLVDNRKASGLKITDSEQRQYSRMLSDWIWSLKSGTSDDPFQQKLVATIERFKIPIWPWERLARAMVYDLAHDGFPTFHTFLRYCEGAAVAPASVFMHLCGVTKQKGVYLKPVFDIRKAARPLAIFSYLVHIIRDFQKDQANNLNYFAHDLLRRYNLSERQLKEIAETGNIYEPFRDLMSRYVAFAERYRRKARTAINLVQPYLKSRSRMSLEIIYSLYLQIFERIDPPNGTFTSSELNPDPGEIQDRIERTIDKTHPQPLS